MPDINENPLTQAVCEIVKAVSSGENVDNKWLDKFVRAKNQEQHDSTRLVAKRRLMPEYLRLKAENPDLLNMSGMNVKVDEIVTKLLQAKPRRTASGVATITVLTKPWPCNGNCVFCPNDIRMPKSYLHNEPACQRAERWDFDPFLQVTSRLKVLYDMGHNIDKIELIILGGTFSNYKIEYQNWFIKECFRACNEFDIAHCDEILKTKPASKKAPQPSNEKIEELQNKINGGKLSYNEAWTLAYSEKETFLKTCQACSVKDVKVQQKINENAGSRVVGLVVETRPARNTLDTLVHFRELGCTKVQIGIQTLDQEVLDKNCRETSTEEIRETLKAMRLLGFKSHVHIMANLMGSTPEKDKQVYRELMTNPDYEPDEVKIYPCCLVESARLTDDFKSGKWVPYQDEELLDIVVENIVDTPPWARISRMIRDISTEDIIAGNKRPNLRQLVENRLRQNMPGMNVNCDNGELNNMPGMNVKEMRFREIANDEVKFEDLELKDVTYKTNCTEEHFLEFVTENDRLAGFLRLSLPVQDDLQNMPGMMKKSADEDLQNMPGMFGKKAPLAESYQVGAVLQGAAMIREVHVYGKVAKIGGHVDSAQHAGLGHKLIERACEIAKDASFERINVISAVGTREYYRSLGFSDGELYQTKSL